MTLNNILTSGYKFENHEYELKSKYILFNSLLTFNMILVFLSALGRLWQAEYTQALFDILYIVLGFVSILVTRRSKLYFRKVAYFVIFYSFIVVSVGFCSDIGQVIGVAWYIILLMTTFFLFDKKEGNAIFLVSVVSIVGIGFCKHDYTSPEIFMGIIPLFVALCFMHFFYSNNKNLKTQLKLANRLLEQSNTKLNSQIETSDNKLNTSKKELLKLQQILDKSPVSVIMTDIHGNIEYANPWSTKITGYSLEELIGNNPRILKSDLCPAQEYAELWDTVTSSGVWNGVFKNINKEGKEYWESAIIAPINNEEGELSNYIAIKQEITQQIYLEKELEKKRKEEAVNFEKTLESFVGLVEKRDSYTAGHSQRVANYSKLIAQEMRFSKQECEFIYRASILHDIGKIGTPDNVLLKPGKLTKLEYRLIQEHVTASYEILSKIPMYEKLADIVIYHHERYDGKGYPNGVKGDAMPLLAQIMIVADAFDAMTTNRIYKGRQEVSEALEELKLCSGKQFHPEVVEASLVALADTELQHLITQLPSTEIEKERFSYFYRDQISQAYNADYLRLVLNQNRITKEYTCINVLYLHNFHNYNKRHSWAEGDKLLGRFASYLLDQFPEHLIFRIYGDDFILLGKEHLEIDMKQFEALNMFYEEEITVTSHHVDLKTEEMLDLDQLES